jgi:hypothetical protein
MLIKPSAEFRQWNLPADSLTLQNADFGTARQHSQVVSIPENRRNARYALKPKELRKIKGRRDKPREKKPKKAPKKVPKEKVPKRATKPINIPPTDDDLKNLKTSIEGLVETKELTQGNKHALDPFLNPDGEPISHELANLTTELVTNITNAFSSVDKVRDLSKLNKNITFKFGSNTSITVVDLIGVELRHVIGQLNAVVSKLPESLSTDIQPTAPPDLAKDKKARVARYARAKMYADQTNRYLQVINELAEQLPTVLKEFGGELCSQDPKPAECDGQNIQLQFAELMRDASYGMEDPPDFANLKKRDVKRTSSLDRMENVVKILTTTYKAQAKKYQTLEGELRQHIRNVIFVGPMDDAADLSDEINSFFSCMKANLKRWTATHQGLLYLKELTRSVLEYASNPVEFEAHFKTKVCALRSSSSVPTAARQKLNKECRTVNQETDSCVQRAKLASKGGSGSKAGSKKASQPAPAKKIGRPKKAPAAPAAVPAKKSGRPSKTSSQRVEEIPEVSEPTPLGDAASFSESPQQEQQTPGDQEKARTPEPAPELVLPKTREDEDSSSSASTSSEETSSISNHEAEESSSAAGTSKTFDDFTSFVLQDRTRDRLSARTGVQNHLTRVQTMWDEYVKAQNPNSDESKMQLSTQTFQEVAKRIFRATSFIFQNEVDLPPTFATDAEVLSFINQCVAQFDSPQFNFDTFSEPEQQALIRDLKRLGPVFHARLLKYQTDIPRDPISNNIALMYREMSVANRKRAFATLYNFVRNNPEVKTLEQVEPAIEKFRKFNSLAPSAPEIDDLASHMKQYVATFYMASFVEHYVLASTIMSFKPDVETRDHEVCGNFVRDTSESVFYYVAKNKTDGPSVGEKCETRGRCDYTEYTNYMFHTHPLSCYAYPSLEDIRQVYDSKIKVMLIFNRWGVFALRRLVDGVWPPFEIGPVQELLDELYHTTRNTQYKSIPWDMLTNEMDRTGRMTRQQAALNVISKLNTLLGQYGIRLNLDLWPDILGADYPLNMAALKADQERLEALQAEDKRLAAARRTKEVVGGRNEPLTAYENVLQELVSNLAQFVKPKQLTRVIQQMVNNPSLVSIASIFPPAQRAQAKKDLRKLNSVLIRNPTLNMLASLLPLVATAKFDKAISRVAQ